MSKADILAEIASVTEQRLGVLKSRLPHAELLRLAGERPPPKDFRGLFQKDGIHIIAEVKRASPSRGDIASDLDPVEVATSYLANGARALSVLTEPRFFKGSIEILKEIRSQHKDAYLLMKDFFVDEYHVALAREAGADAVLVIMAMLGKERARTIFLEAKRLGLTPLVEVHNAAELADAVSLGASLIGINNRDLKTMTISLETTIELIKSLPAATTVIGESGIETSEDLLRLKASGCAGFLIGTSFMASGDPGGALAKLIREASAR